jgi:hypothetical protein
VVVEGAGVDAEQFGDRGDAEVTTYSLCPKVTVAGITRQTTL